MEAGDGDHDDVARFAGAFGSLCRAWFWMWLVYGVGLSPPSPTP